MNLSYLRRRALEWIKKNEPVSVFPLDGSAPQIRFVRRLEKEGLVKRVGTTRGSSIVQFALSTAGRSALKEAE